MYLITKNQSHKVLLSIDAFVKSYRLSRMSFDVYFWSLSHLCCFAGLSSPQSFAKLSAVSSVAQVSSSSNFVAMTFKDILPHSG
jgi:hypothetical protein